MTIVADLISRMWRDIPDQPTASDFRLLTSHEEGFANALLEGMSAGLPMIATDVGGRAKAEFNVRAC